MLLLYCQIMVALVVHVYAQKQDHQLGKNYTVISDHYYTAPNICHHYIQLDVLDPEMQNYDKQSEYVEEQIGVSYHSFQ